MRPTKKQIALYQVAEIDWTTRIYLPVTLRQIETAGVLLDAEQGCDDAEHQSMLDEPGTFRLRVDSEVLFPDGDRRHLLREYCSGRTYSVEAFQATLDDPSERWMECVAGSQFAPAGEAALRTYQREQRSALERLADSVMTTDADAMLAHFERRAQRWAYQCQD